MQMKTEGEGCTLKAFVAREKLSKKNRKELERKKRVMWQMNPETRVVESKKVYNRKKVSRMDAGDFF